jgi:hypothetical protein
VDRLIGEHVKLLVGLPPLVKGTICVVRNVLTYGGAESPEDPMSLEHDRTRITALRRDVEELDGVRSLNSPPRDNLT